MLKLAFLMDPIHSIKSLEDTSFLIMEEAYKRGHSIYFLEPHDLTLHSKKGLRIHFKKVSVDEINGIKVLKDYPDKPLDFVDCLWIRKDPPFDLAYFHFLLLLTGQSSKTFILNNPIGILLGNEKLLPFHFAEFMPETLVSHRKDLLREFTIKNKKAVWKPLDDRSGHGVKLLNSKNFNYKESRWGLSQEFLPKVKTQGDKRIFLLDGKPLTAYFRTPPRGGWLVTPDSDDGLLLKAPITVKEKKIIKSIGPKLRQMGLYFVGLDIIQEKITEINITSPGGIAEANRFHDEPLQNKIVDFLERKTA